MANLNIRYFLIVVLMAITGSLVQTLQLESTQDSVAGLKAIQSIPLQIGMWQGYDAPLDDEVYEILETKAILHRNYVSSSGDQVFLSIVHYNDTKVDFHAPEACLGGLGERTTKSIKKLVLQLNSKSFTLELAEIISQNSNRQNLAYYFYKTGEFHGQNYIQMRLNIAKNRIMSQDSSGSLIRISTDMTQNNKKAHHLLEIFLTDLIPVIEQAL